MKEIKELIQINAPAKIKEELKELAKQKGISLNAFILMIIYDYLGKTR